MSCFRCGDPLDDFDRLDMEQARYEARLPVCEKCGKTIHEDNYYDDGDILCRDCLLERYERSTEDYANAHE